VSALHTIINKKPQLWHDLLCPKSGRMFSNGLISGVKFNVIPLFAPVLAGEGFTACLVGETFAAGAAAETWIGCKKFNQVSCAAHCRVHLPWQYDLAGVRHMQSEGAL